MEGRETTRLVKDFLALEEQRRAELLEEAFAEAGRTWKTDRPTDWEALHETESFERESASLEPAMHEDGTRYFRLQTEMALPSPGRHGHRREYQLAQAFLRDCRECLYTLIQAEESEPSS